MTSTTIGISQVKKLDNFFEGLDQVDTTTKLNQDLPHSLESITGMGKYIDLNKILYETAVPIEQIKTEYPGISKTLFKISDLSDDEKDDRRQNDLEYLGDNIFLLSNMNDISFNVTEYIEPIEYSKYNYIVFSSQPVINKFTRSC